MRIISGCSLLFVLVFTSVCCFAQADSLVHASSTLPRYHNWHYVDTLALKETRISTGIAMQVLKYPDPGRPNQFIQNVIKVYAFKPYYFNNPALKKAILRTGKLRYTRDVWPLWVIIALVVYTAILNRVIRNDIYLLVTTFYNRRSLVKASREDSFLNSWAFIFLFILFGLTIGLFIYQLTAWYGIKYPISGFGLFMLFSVAVIALFILKILSIRFLGFIFDIKRFLRDYISVLYLTYFNIAFLFLPVVVGFSLLSSAYIPHLIVFAVCLASLIFLIQYVRTAIKIISNIRFQKIYLFIYLCALEICPILILIKALDL